MGMSVLTKEHLILDQADQADGHSDIKCDSDPLPHFLRFVCLRMSVALLNGFLVADAGPNLFQGLGLHLLGRTQARDGLGRASLRDGDRAGGEVAGSKLLEYEKSYRSGVQIC